MTRCRSLALHENSGCPFVEDCSSTTWQTDFPKELFYNISWIFKSTYYINFQNDEDYYLDLILRSISNMYLSGVSHL